VTNVPKDVAYTYDVTADDVDSAAFDLTITAALLPTWLTMTDKGDGAATLHGIPTEANVGDHPVALQVSDGAAAATQSFTITVTSKENYYLYLPMILSNHSVSAYYGDKGVAAIMHIAR
jgi:hypothetical protein